MGDYTNCEKCKWFRGFVTRINQYGCEELLINCVFFGYENININSLTCRGFKEGRNEE